MRELHRERVSRVGGGGWTGSAKAPHGEASARARPSGAASAPLCSGGLMAAPLLPPPGLQGCREWSALSGTGIQKALNKHTTSKLQSGPSFRELLRGSFIHTLLLCARQRSGLAKSRGNQTEEGSPVPDALASNSARDALRLRAASTSGPYRGACALGPGSRPAAFGALPLAERAAPSVRALSPPPGPGPHRAARGRHCPCSGRASSSWARCSWRRDVHRLAGPPPSTSDWREDAPPYHTCPRHGLVLDSLTRPRLRTPRITRAVA